MGFSRQGAGLYRLLGAPAARLTAKSGAMVLALGLFAGAVRVLPLFVGHAAPPRLSVPLARSVLAVSLETALFVAPPLAWALACAALVERGEARALFAVGARPARLVASAWPAALLVVLASALASAAWGREAAAPGRLARELVAEARAACVGAVTGRAPVAVDVPSLGFSWVCFPDEEPRIVGPAPFGDGAAVLAASAIHLSDDLRAVHLEGVTVAMSAESPRPLASARLRAADVSIRGIAPLGRASNLGVFTRAGLLALSAALIASLAALTVLSLSIRSRAGALAVGVAGPAASLLVFSALERSATSPLAYAAVPLAGLAAVCVVFAGGRALRAARR